MNSELIIISEYCSQSHIEPEFIFSLEHEGLIEIRNENNEYFLHISQIDILERYARWYYDLSVNVEGIDIIQNLLDRMSEMQKEISRLREIAGLLNK